MAYSAQVKSTAKARYDTGNYTLKQIAQEMHIPERVISGWSMKEKWGESKKELAPIIANGVRQELINRMVKAGVRDKMADGLIEALNAMKTVVIPSRATDPETGKPEPGFANEVRDWRAFMDAVENLRKIIGLDAPTKTEIDVNVKIQGCVAIFGKIIEKYVLPDKKNECLDDLANAIEAQG